MNINIKETKILVVEGKDEEMFFSALVAHLGITGIQVLGIGGKTQLRSRLKAIKLAPNFANVVSLGVVRDADASVVSAFQSVCGALQAANLPVPERMLEPVDEILRAAS